jgi:DNA-binding CsgD family transcriptional regulator
MKIKLLILHFFIIGNIYSQNTISFFKDLNGSYNFETIKTADFNKYENTISDGFNKAIYWFKISNLNASKEYVFRIKNPHIHNVKAFQNSVELTLLLNERYTTIPFISNNELFVRIEPRKESYLPIEVIEERAFLLQEKYQTLLIGLYFGFAFFIIISNIFYFFVFDDDAFIYYSLFLFSTSFGLFVTDGMLNLIGVSERAVDFSIVIAYTLVAFFSSKFSSAYLQLDLYYPKLKLLPYAIGLAILILSSFYLITDNFIFLILISILVFSVFLVYWLAGVTLFKKNVFIKIFTFAFVAIFLLSINYYVFKVFGVSSGSLNSTYIKFGGFIEMIVLSLAVIYRMKVLKGENRFMRNKIVSYAAELEKLVVEVSNKQKDEKLNFENLLSIRENEIFELIVSSKSNQEIANQLNISLNTVKFHIKNMYEKLQVKSRKEVLSLAKNSLKQEFEY